MLGREDMRGNPTYEVFSHFTSDTTGNFKAAVILDILTQALAGGRPDQI